MLSPDERAALVRAASSSPRPGSIEEAEALDRIDQARAEEAEDERKRAKRRERWDN